MPTTHKKNLTTAQPAVEQVINNTTSWIGQRPGDNNEIISGQTFVSPSECDLNGIKIFSAIVFKPGKMNITLHSFDASQKSWGPVLGSASIEVNKDDAGKWLSFNLPGLHLNKDKAYGFRLDSPNTFVGIGEAAGSHQHPPFDNGQEWKFSTKDKKEHSFSYFSLAFKIELRA